jgi:branched-chain amino acid transport system ATP-binding protein
VPHEDGGLLEVDSLVVFYENAIAINDVDLTVAEGEVVGVVGANSAGKTTLLHAVSGVLLDIRRREEMAGGERITLLGRIVYRGDEITSLKASDRARRGIVLCPERRRLFGESTVLENLKTGGYLRTGAERRESLDFVHRLFPELVRLGRRRAGFLSGGEQQMVAIGRALMARPRLLLLDEPLLGLAPQPQGRVVHAIQDIGENLNITILVAEQYAKPILPIVDRAYVIENGSLTLSGTGRELMDNPEVKAAYFGV